MADGRADLLPGTVEMLALTTLAVEPMHGWGISQRIQQISQDALQVQQGSLYPALHRLEQQGWISAEWKESDLGRSAKFYSLTRAGRKQLEIETADWNRRASAIARLLKAGA